jgi:LPS-assembly protein
LAKRAALIAVCVTCGLWPALARAGAAVQAAEGSSCAQLSDQYPEPPALGDGRLHLSADQVQLEQGGLSSLLGSVKLSQGGKEFSAQSLDYDDAARVVHVRAESVFRNQQIMIRSQSADFDLNADTGSFFDTDFTVQQRAARGVAQRVSLDRAGTAEFDDVRYTTCAPGSEAWFLQAGKINLDYAEGLGTARNARLTFFDVPILYLPWFRFPIDNRRRTGLLFPTVGDSNKTGFDMRQPLYLNLAPNYDATFTPRLMSQRGVQLDTEMRYLLPRAEGSGGYEWLSRDRVTNEERSYVHFEHLGLINSRLGLDARYAEASDPQYFEDLGGKVDISSITHLERSARLTYQAPAAYTVQGLVQDYQTIASNLTAADDPYRRLPEVRIDALTRKSWNDTRIGFSGEYVNFQRDNSVEGQRLDLDPYLRFEKDQLAWYTRGQLDLRYTGYALTGVAPGAPNTPDRVLPMMSAEGGLRFERVLDSGDLQTLEPRVLYLFVPYDNQDDLPVFDSGEPDFDFTQLFARNRFSGADRVSDADHFAIAATGRQLDPTTGVARISASIGQLYRLSRPRVQLPGAAAPEEGATDFIGQVDYTIADHWSTSFSTQWSPKTANFTRAAVAVHYLAEQQRLDVAYRFRRDLLEQADLTTATPLWGGLHLAGRWRYSIRESKSLDTLAGVEYETCCWAVRSSYRRFIANTSGEYNNGVYLQLEFKGLTRVGSAFPGLLPVEQEVY